MTDDRLSELAERVAALELRLSTREATADPSSEPAPDHPSTGADLGDTFWVLDGLAHLGADAVVYAGLITPPGQESVRWQITRAGDELLADDWAERAAAISALGHPVRLQILQLVVTGAAATAAELASAEGLGSTGQIYHHLRQLVTAGWLRATSRGHHDVPPERLVPLLTVLSAAR